MKTSTEWGKIGGQITHQIALEKRKSYSENPSLCEFCKKPIPYENRAGKFCCRSHAAKVNNSGKKRNPNGINGLPRKQCPACGTEVKGGTTRTLCVVCKPPRETWASQKTRYESLGKVEASSDERGAAHARRYLLETRERECEICHNTEWLGQPIPLVADHINGDSADHRFENLRLICNNCDSLLPTYKAKNWGNGRSWRYKTENGTARRN